jgi:hypothetical protein
MKAKNQTRITTAEMKFFGKTAKNTSVDSKRQGT